MKQTWGIEDLDCANCAAKLENALRGVPGVEAVRVDFISKKLTLTAADERFAAVLEAVVKKAAEVEPDAHILLHGGEARQDAHHGGHDHDHDHDHCHDGCCHEHEHTHEHGGGESEWGTLWRVGAAVALLVAGLLVSGWAGVALMIAAYLVVGWDVLYRAARNIGRGQIFDENFLMAVASIGALVMGEYAEGVAVMALYQVGEWFQDRAVDKSRASIAALMDIRPDYATLLRDGALVRISPDEAKVGDLILVKPGEKIPLDGVVTEGASSLNTVALTGESLPRDVAAGDSVVSGCVNLSGVLTIRVTSVFAESTVAKILALVESSGNGKAKAERFITRFARVYTPCVCLAALLLAVVPPLFDGMWRQWIGRALTFLVISCPCALVISVPLTFFSGIGGASRKGILIKGANYMETLANLNAVVFDKTGTLTKGVFTVTAIHPAATDKERLLELAALAESYSDHPISRSLQSAYNRAVDRSRIGQVEEIAGQGIHAVVDGHEVYAGNERLLAGQGIQAKPCHRQGTIIHIARDGQYMGHIVISDVVKPTSAEAIRGLKDAGVQRLVMLTGDHRAVAEETAKTLGLTEVHAELMPEDKVKRLDSILNGDGRTAFVGDGINDAPVLRRADLGVAMGALGSDAAIEAADVVLMDDDPLKLPLAIGKAHKTLRIVRQNIVLALGVKALVLALGAVGVASMWLAIFADVGVAMLAILNAMRAMR